MKSARPMTKSSMRGNAFLLSSFPAFLMMPAEAIDRPSSFCALRDNFGK